MQSPQFSRGRDPAPILPLDRLRAELSTVSTASIVAVAADQGSSPDFPSAAAPTPVPRRFSTGGTRQQLDGLAWELRGLGFVGARWFVRMHLYEHIREAVAEVFAALAAGDEIRNPGGYVRYLVRLAEEAADDVLSTGDTSPLAQPGPPPARLERAPPASTRVPRARRMGAS